MTISINNVDKDISTALTKLASDIQALREWDATFQYAVQALESNGLDKEAATSLVLAASEDSVQEALSAIDATSLPLIMAKTASYVGELQAKLQDAEAELLSAKRQLVKVASDSRASAFGSLKETGLTEDELASLEVLPEGVIEKLASFTQASPSAMGRGAGISSSDSDPFLAFLLSDM